MSYTPSVYCNLLKYWTLTRFGLPIKSFSVQLLEMCFFLNAWLQNESWNGRPEVLGLVSLREQRWIGRDSERAVLLLQAGDWVPPALLSSAPAQLQRGSGRTRPSHSRPLHDWTGPRRLGWGKNHRIMMFGAVLALMHCCTCSLLNESCLSSCFSLLWFNSSIIQRYFWILWIILMFVYEWGWSCVYLFQLTAEQNQTFIEPFFKTVAKTKEYDTHCFIQMINTSLNWDYTVV